MAVAQRGTASNYLQRAPSPSGLADVLDVILDKGLVIDAYVRVSVIGIEVLTIDARIVIASVDTYLRFAEQVNRLDLAQTRPPASELCGGGSDQKTKGVIEGAKEKLTPGKDKDKERSRARDARLPSSRRRPSTYVYGIVPRTRSPRSRPPAFAAPRWPSSRRAGSPPSSVSCRTTSFA